MASCAPAAALAQGAPVTPATSPSSASAASASVQQDSRGSAAVAAGVSATNAAPSAQSVAVQEIIVTAQKREQSINKVPLSVTAVTGDALLQRGVFSTADLTKVVPGLSFAPTTFGDPVYVIRGVGLYDSGLGSSPAVTVYLDQVPLAYPATTEVAPLDLERVEVLKGPQGTLFGENSTGGAVNYIAAKPTKTYQAGADITYERFGELDATGFVGGPITDTLGFRASLRTVEGGAYQYSLTRPDVSLGAQNIGQGRLILDWRPTGKLKFELDVNGFYDGSDTQAQQLTAVVPAVPANASAALLNAPLAPRNDRAADWPAGYPLRSNDTFYQVSLRSDYALTSGITMTSLTAYEHTRVDKSTDGTGLGGEGPDINLFIQRGDIRTFSQELRVSGVKGPLIWTAGGNYQYSGISDNEIGVDFETADQPVGPFAPPYHYPEDLTRQVVNDYALFGNVDYRATHNITLHAGVRGTESDRHASSCTFDYNPGADNDGLSVTSDVLQGLFQSIGLKTTPLTPVAPSGCVSLTPAPDLQPSGIHNHLNEENLSWRLGADYTFDNGTLVYASDNVGYKSGIISPILASSTAQLQPVKQERIDAYEAGFKAPLFQRRIQVNGALFYDSYDDKQLRTDYRDPVFGLLETLINIPRSQIWGAEGEIQAKPLPGLNLSLSGTYLETDVTKSFVSFNGEGALGDYKGSQLPYTPKGEIIADGQYQWPMIQGFNAFAGVSLTYRSASQATFNTASAPAPDFRLPSYALVDLRGGLTTEDGRYRLTLFARNVGDTFYATTVNQTTDTRYRTAGAPQVYGATLSLRWR